MGEQKKERNQKESRRKRHREIVAERERKKGRDELRIRQPEGARLHSHTSKREEELLFRGHFSTIVISKEDAFHTVTCHTVFLPKHVCARACQSSVGEASPRMCVCC